MCRLPGDRDPPLAPGRSVAEDDRRGVTPEQFADAHAALELPEVPADEAAELVRQVRKERPERERAATERDSGER